MTIKVLLAEDHTIVREGLAAMIEKQNDMIVIGQAQNGLEATKLAQTLKPHVVVMDVSMPMLNGVEAAKKIKASDSAIKILALSAHDKREYVIDMIRAGVSGYLLKDCISTDLIQAIRRLMQNESFLSPRIAAIIINEQNDQNPDKFQPPAVLKEKELKVLKLLANGLSAKDIAEKNNINIKTVEAQRRRIMTKLNIDNFADLVKYAIRTDLTSY
jgi:two-component system, NarL family, response regulator NreC